MADKPQRTKVFISYSHRDSDSRDRLLVHLEPLVRDGGLEVWADNQIQAGEKWGDSIETALNEAKVAILLISADFLASRFISKNELPPLLAAEEDEGLVILPVILKPSRFNRIASLSQFQSINSPAKPLLKLSDVEQEEIWVDLSNRVEDILKQSVFPPSPPKVSPKTDTSTTKATSFENFAELLDNDVKLEMVAISGGGFWMGSPDNEEEREDRESPQHRVNLSPFWMGKYPVTQGQWMEVAAFPKVKEDLKPQPSKFFGLDRPVEQISWFEAVEFCDRLSRQTGKNYRLPSEAEWEYACRARTVTPFSFGETISTDLANYDGNYTYGKGSKGEYREQTTPVATFKPNAFGLYDMHGNVWEWCADHWHKNYEGAPPGGTPWIDGGDSKLRVLRGGSWYFFPRNCRSADRGGGEPDDRSGNNGFRVVCSSA